MNCFQKINSIHDVSRETYERLELFAALCNQWTKSINLVSNSNADNLWDRHICDSLRVARHIPENTAVISDFGSGGGFPGIILAILAPWKVHLVESNQKKCAFLAAVSSELKLNTQIHTARIESLTPWDSDVVTARALAPLSKLFELLHPFISRTQKTLFFKGRGAEEEVLDAAKNWEFSHILYEEKNQESGPIVEIKDLSRRNV
jgi:16S rRNA (guanine527-N7)-methyltransferase